MDRRGRLFPSLLVLLAIVLAFAVGFVFAQSTSQPTTGLPGEFARLGEVWQYLDRYYVNQTALDPEELSQAAIEGLLDALDDPYTSYIDAELYELEWSAFEGSFEGIGAVVTMDDGQLTVVSPIAGGPAEEQGVRTGDWIVEIDGEPTEGMGLAEAVLKIRGAQGTTVSLLIIHLGEITPVAIDIVREEITLDSVHLDMLAGDIAHIQITHFSERTDKEMVVVLNEALDDGARAIVLDLRNNPGGYLSVVVNVADEFLDGGTVLYQRDTEGALDESKASPGGLATDLPIVVLVNESSASGSEVLAGALQDRGRAPLVGTTTYGKGSVNVMIELSDGSAIYVTVAHWLTPNGNLIEGQGLTPDFEVELSADDIANDRDPQLDFALEHVSSEL
ncbi:MAG: S41 family peptidase [Chloroflexota bacterium]|nr:S41 family peptidase [Chloroflexota bacterium]